RVTPSAASEHVSELLGCPISRSLTACCVCLELRPLPSTGITRLPRYYEPLRHPSAPGLSLAGVRLIIPDHALGLPVLRALSLCTCCRHYPGAAAGRTPHSSHPAVSAFPGRGRRVGLHIDLFEACSAFTRVAACTLARSPLRDPLSEGFRHFVSSMPAPVASGWSGRRVGLAPTGNAPPCHGARGVRTFQRGGPEGSLGADAQGDCGLVADGVSELDGIARGYRRRDPSGRSGEAVPRGRHRIRGPAHRNSQRQVAARRRSNPTNDGERRLSSTLNRPLHYSKRRMAGALRPWGF